MTQRLGNWPKYLGNDLDTCGTALVFEKNDVDLWEMAQICGEMT